MKVPANLTVENGLSHLVIVLEYLGTTLLSHSSTEAALSFQCVFAAAIAGLCFCSLKKNYL